jgi:hypothetical protein
MMAAIPAVAIARLADSFQFTPSLTEEKPYATETDFYLSALPTPRETCYFADCNNKL